MATTKTFKVEAVLCDDGSFDAEAMCESLRSQLGHLNDERETYVPMIASELASFFENQKDKVPLSSLVPLIVNRLAPTEFKAHKVLAKEVNAYIHANATNQQDDSKMFHIQQGPNGGVNLQKDLPPVKVKK